MRIAFVPDIDSLVFGTQDGGNTLIPVVAQHALTGDVLMVAYADREAVERTITRSEMWFYSRSRGVLWRKGDTSGNILKLVSLHADCDRDALLARVLPAGPACHTGARACFDGVPTLSALENTIVRRIDEPTGNGYTNRLLSDANLRHKKLGEEAVELALACTSDETESVAEEAADLLYHALVACRAAGVTLADILSVLERRSR